MHETNARAQRNNRELHLELVGDDAVEQPDGVGAELGGDGNEEQLWASGRRKK